MTNHIEWLIPDYVLSATVVGPISAVEVQQVANTLIDEINTAPTSHLVHLMVDVRECILAEKAWSYSKLQLHRHTNTGWVLVIGDSRMGGLVIAIFSKILQMQIHYSPSPEAALNFIAQRDPAVAEYRHQSGDDSPSGEA
jgi:hypothetical protein